MTRITFLVHPGKEYTVAKYLRSWGRPLASWVDLKVYPGSRTTGRNVWKRASQRLRSWRVGAFRPPPPRSGRHIYVFTDVERLDAGETERALALWETLSSRDDTSAILNHPVRSMRRLELLETLHAEGRNDFAVYRAEDDPEPARWPVFVREANDHTGAASARCHDRASLRAAIEDLERRGVARHEAIVVEYCDTADEDGVIRKYGAFRVGDRILARQIHFSRHWVVRVPDIVTPATAAEEAVLVAENPHAEALREVFDLARIDYGRIDYAVRDGRIQVWEINTNPMILIPSDADDPLRGAAHDRFGRNLGDALRALAGRPS